jgi:TolA-binding protein
MYQIAFQLDPSLHQNVIEWHKEQNEDTVSRDVFLLGYSCFASGLKDYFKLNERATLETTLEQTFENRVRAAVSESEYRCQLLKERSQELNNEINSLRETVRLLRESSKTNVNEAIELERQRFEQELQRTRETLTSELKQTEKYTNQLLAMKTEESLLFKAKWEATSKLLAEKDHEYTERIASLCASEEIKQLRDQIASKNAELLMLRNGNFVKGLTGEFMLRERLQNMFPDWLFEHTGKNPHECDLHMSNASSDTILIESKNKDAITKNDIDKFYSDISHAETIQKRCIGAIFISIRSRNIPWKGQVCLEFVNGIPVLFIGFSGEDEVALHLQQYSIPFIQYCTLVAKQTNTVEGGMDTIFTVMNSQFQSILSSKIQIDKLKGQVLEVLKVISELEKNNLKTCQSLETFLKQHNRLELNKKYHVCERCNQYFTNKKELEKHLRSCSGRVDAV